MKIVVRTILISVFLFVPLISFAQEKDSAAKTRQNKCIEEDASFGFAISFLGTEETTRPTDVFSNSDVVFIGTVISGCNLNADDKDNVEITHYAKGRVKFAVKEVFSGEISNEIEVYCGVMCRKSFDKGQTYLVYAGYGFKNENRLEINDWHNRTRLLSKADEDLKFLRNLPPKGTGAEVYGEVLKTEKGHFLKLENFRVVFENDKNRYEVNTDDSGFYLIERMKPGKYTIKVDVPDGYVLQFTSDKATVRDRGTHIILIEFDIKQDEK